MPLAEIQSNASASLKMKQPILDWNQIIEGTVYFHALAIFSRL